jgi:hypothetical protein
VGLRRARRSLALPEDSTLHNTQHLFSDLYKRLGVFSWFHDHRMALQTTNRREWGTSYSLDRCRWEFVVDSRKILMTAISVFLGNERIFIKTILIVLVCFVSFAGQVENHL